MSLPATQSPPATQPPPAKQPPLTAAQLSAMSPEEKNRIAREIAAWLAQNGPAASSGGVLGPAASQPKGLGTRIGNVITNIGRNFGRRVGEKYGLVPTAGDVASARFAAAENRRRQLAELLIQENGFSEDIRHLSAAALENLYAERRVGAYFNNLTPEQAKKIGLSPAQLALVRANPQASYDDVVDRSFKRETFSTTPQYGLTATGSRLAYQLGDAGSLNILDIVPTIEFEKVDKGSHVLIYEKGTGKLLETIPKKMTPDQAERLVIEKDQKTKGDTERISARAKSMRQEFNQITSSMRDVALSYGKIKSAEKAASDQSGERKGAADIALIFNYMKLLDPGSVVREGEFATARNAGGIPDRVVAIYNGVVKGDILSKEVRTSFVAAAEEVLKPYRDQFHATKIRYSNLAKSEGVEPDRVVMNDPFSGLTEEKYEERYTKDWYIKHGFTPPSGAK